MSTEQKSSIEVIERAMYGSVNTLIESHRNRLYFTEPAAARLMSIAGYILGLRHSGNLDFADKMADDLLARLERLAMPHYDVEFRVSKVPGMKCVLSDDGTLHGFGACWYRPIDPDRMDEIVRSHQQEIDDQRDQGETVYDTALQRAKTQLRVMESVDSSNNCYKELTHHCYSSDHGSLKVYYTFAFKGCMIYHGPGQGETFTVNLGQTLWGIHT